MFFLLSWQFDLYLLSWLSLIQSGQINTHNNLVRVSLQDVSSFTVQANLSTTGHHTVPQLTCKGGSAQGLYQIPEMICTNIAGKGEFGTDELNWRCTAELPEEFKLGSTDVSCEAWRDPKTGEKSRNGDIVRSSCGVDYILMLTDVGESKFSGRTTDSTNHQSLSQYFFWMVFASIAGYIAYNIFRSSTQDNSAGTSNRRHHAAGGNRGDEDDDKSENGNGFDGPRTCSRPLTYADIGCSWTPTIRTRLSPRSHGSSSSTINHPGSSVFSSSASYSGTSFGGTSHR